MTFNIRQCCQNLFLLCRVLWFFAEVLEVEGSAECLGVFFQFNYENLMVSKREMISHCLEICGIKLMAPISIFTSYFKLYPPKYYQEFGKFYICVKP